MNNNKIINCEINIAEDIKNLKGNNITLWQKKAFNFNSSRCLWYEKSLDNNNDEKVLNHIEDFNKYEKEYQLVDFHFLINQPIEICDKCAQSIETPSIFNIGKSPEAQKLLSYYNSDDETLRWNNKITQPELDKIWELGLKNKKLLYPHFDQKPSLEEYNSLSCSRPCRWDILIKLEFLHIRCKLQGIEELCPTCKGYGYMSDENGHKNDYPATLNLKILCIHKKYSSRQYFVLKDISEEDLKNVFDCLYKLGQENFKRYAVLKDAIK